MKKYLLISLGSIIIVLTYLLLNSDNSISQYSRHWPLFPADTLQVDKLQVFTSGGSITAISPVVIPKLTITQMNVTGAKITNDTIGTDSVGTLKAGKSTFWQMNVAGARVTNDTITNIYGGSGSVITAKDTIVAYNGIRIDSVSNIGIQIGLRRDSLCIKIGNSWYVINHSGTAIE
jgi:hypothetical protein